MQQSSSKHLERALSLLGKVEGGLSNHPDDPGGLTNLGVTQRLYDSFRRIQGLPLRSVREIGPDEVEAIYRYFFWDTCKGDSLAAFCFPLAYEVFEFSVNAGVGVACRALQRAYDIVREAERPALVVDGILGPMSLEALGGFCDQGYAFALLAAINGEQYLHYRKLIVGNKNERFRSFIRGWMRRVSVPAEAQAA